MAGDNHPGIYVRAVRVGWPAHLVGLETGDVITKVDDVQPSTEEQFTNAVHNAFAECRGLVLTVIDVRTGRHITRKVFPSPVDGKLGVYYAFVKPEPVEKIKALFERRGFDPQSFPGGEFDTTKQDPLPFYVTWSGLRPALEKLLQQELALEERPRLQLVLIADKRTKTRCRFVFSAQKPAVEKVLRQVLPLSDQPFVRPEVLDKLVVSTYVRTPAFLKDYRKEDGSVDFSKVEEALVNFQRPGSLKNLAVTPFSSADKYVYVRSAWKQSEELRTVNGRYFYRLVQGIQKHPKDAELWLLFARFEMVWLPNTQSDPERWRGRVVTSDSSPDLAQRLYCFVGTSPKTVPDLRFSADKVREGELPPGTVQVSVAARSTLLQTAESLMQLTAVKFCGKLPEQFERPLLLEMLKEYMPEP
jgi:hypothetical protein